MVFLPITIDQHVIQISRAKYVKILLQRFIDVSLESLKCVTQAKWHDKVLELAVPAVEGREPLVAFLYPYLVECMYDI